MKLVENVISEFYYDSGCILYDYSCLLSCINI